MKIIEPRRDKITVGDKSIEAMQSEWLAWSPPPVSQPDVVPPGWLSSAQYAALKGRSPAQARRDLAAGVAAGMIETQTFRVTKASKGLAHVPHYRLKG